MNGWFACPASVKGPGRRDVPTVLVAGTPIGTERDDPVSSGAAMGYSPYRGCRPTDPRKEATLPLSLPPPRAPGARPRTAATAARRTVALALALPLAGCAPESVTSQGDAAHFAYDFFLWAAAVVWCTVTGLMVWSMIRYRRRNDELPKQIHGSNKRELTWTLIPFALVLVLFGVTLNAQSKILHRAKDPAATIQVTAFQWSWQFNYQGSRAQVIGQPGRPPTMVVPVGVPVRIRLVSADVVHSFYVPRTLFKRQAIPGTVNQFDLTFDRVGIFHGQCTQFCGVAHADMRFDVKVVSSSEFQSWLETTSRASGGNGT